MGRIGRLKVVITATTALTAQEVRFPGYVEWVRFINNSPITISILGHGEEVMDVILPGDIWPEDFDTEDFNSFRLYGDAASAAADITAGLILYIKYRLKRRDPQGG